MTVSTPAQLRAKATYRAKQKAKVERMEDALWRIVRLRDPSTWVTSDTQPVFDVLDKARHLARQALEVKP